MTSAPHPLTVAVTGHRWNGLGESDPPQLAGRVDDFLEALRLVTTRRGDGRASRFEASPVLVLSGMAEGADRIVAERALALGIDLRALLPFPRDAYADDFPSDGSKEEFADLLARAKDVRELVGSDDDRAAAYETLGIQLLGEADVLLAIWDGRAARGEGGTASVITHALERSLPVVWIHASRPHELAVYGHGAAIGLSVDRERLADELAELLE